MPLIVPEQGIVSEVVCPPLRSKNDSFLEALVPRLRTFVRRETKKKAISNADNSRLYELFWDPNNILASLALIANYDPEKEAQQTLFKVIESLDLTHGRTYEVLVAALNPSERYGVTEVTYSFKGNKDSMVRVPVQGNRQNLLTFGLLHPERLPNEIDVRSVVTQFARGFETRTFITPSLGRPTGIGDFKRPWRYDD